MAEKVPMTALSPTMEEGTITTWNVKEGDTISAGDVLCEVETDKASMEYEATQEGTLLKIVVGEGGNAVVGRTIAILGAAGEDVGALVQEVLDEPDGSASPPSGDGAAAPVSGGGEVAPAAGGGAPVDAATSAGAAPAQAGGVAPLPTGGAVAAGRAVGGDGSRLKASPLAVKMAAERRINLALVTGSGPGGRIVMRDVEAFRGVPGGAAATAAAGGAPPVGGFASAPAPADREIPVTGKRAVIARRLSESKFSAPHYYLTNSVAMERLVGARSLLNAGGERKVSLNAFFIKFAAEAIKRHPTINASWHGEAIIEHGAIDIGLAVDVGGGLITPVVRNTGNRGIVDIDTELQELITKAREGKLKPEEYTGATFTISNLGSFGVEEFTAIINPPGAAILALGQTLKQPVVREDGTLGVGSIMKMTLSCDHRVIDGAAGGRFLSELKRMMEEPVRVIF